MPIILEFIFRLFFFFSGSSLARLEPEQKLFEVDAIGDDGDDDLLHHHLPTAQLNSSEVFLSS